MPGATPATVMAKAAAVSQTVATEAEVTVPEATVAVLLMAAAAARVTVWRPPSPV